MEKKLIGWVSRYAEQHELLPTKLETRSKAIELSTVDKFQGSQGWVDKFYQRFSKTVDKIKKGEFLKTVEGKTDISISIEKKKKSANQLLLNSDGINPQFKIMKEEDNSSFLENSSNSKYFVNKIKIESHKIDEDCIKEEYTQDDRQDLCVEDNDFLPKDMQKFMKIKIE